MIEEKYLHLCPECYRYGRCFQDCSTQKDDFGKLVGCITPCDSCKAEQVARVFSRYRILRFE